MQGPAWLLLGIALFGLLDASNKLLSSTYPLGQVVGLRYAALLGLLLVARACWPGLGGPLGTARPWAHALRAGCMMVSAMCFFLGFRTLPLAEGYLVFFTAPFLTLAFAAAVLREPVPRAAWAWCAVGFAGVGLAVAPKLGGGGAWVGYALVLLGTVTFAITQTVNRALRDEPGFARILFWPSVLGVALFALPGAVAWVPPGPGDLALLLGNGAVAGMAVAVTARAYARADAARLGPWNYAALPVSVGLDLGIWGVWPDPWTIAGGVVVVGACLMSERARITGSRAETHAPRPGQAAPARPSVPR